jgi:hypothetical protein
VAPVMVEGLDPVQADPYRGGSPQSDLRDRAPKASAASLCQPRGIETAKGVSCHRAGRTWLRTACG